MHPFTRALFATCVVLIYFFVRECVREKFRGPPPFV
jgi:hypothetical protein